PVHRVHKTWRATEIGAAIEQQIIRHCVAAKGDVVVAASEDSEELIHGVTADVGKISIGARVHSDNGGIVAASGQFAICVSVIAPNHYLIEARPSKNVGFIINQ